MSIFVLKQEPDMWNFISEDFIRSKKLDCKKCGLELDKIYSYIILKLQQSNLLPKNYEPMCCMCNKIRKTLEHYQCGICKAYIDFEYFPFRGGRSCRLVCNTKGCKFKKKILTL